VDTEIPFEEWEQHDQAVLDVAAYVRSQKRDVDEDLSRLVHAKTSIFMRSQKYASRLADDSADEHSESGLFSRPPDIFELIGLELDAIRPSYAAPGIHLNSYLEAHAVDIEWDVVKHTLDEDAPRPSMGLRSTAVEVHWGATMLAIKAALDRIVRVMRFYYPGFAPYTTWGRYKANGKPDGFMSIVHGAKDSDELLAYFDRAYIEWIVAAVAPRDALTHYNDPYSTWHLLPGVHALVSSQHIEDDAENGHSSGIHTLTSLVQRWYDFADYTFAALVKKEPKSRRKSPE
jgi:hypothetical protein